MKFRILNGEPLEFFNAQGDRIGLVSISSSGEMFIQSPSGSGDITIGNPNTTGDVQIGTTAAPTTLSLMGGGTITGNGNALIIGNAVAGDRVSIRNASFTQSLEITGSLRVTGSAYANTFIGNGSGLTNVSASYVNELNQNLIITGSITVRSGSITIPNRSAFSVYGSGTTNNLSTTQNGDGTLNSNNYAVNFYHGSGFDSASGIFTAPVAGLYQVDVVGRNSGYASGISQLCVLRNNSNASGDVLMIEWAASSTMNHTGASKIFKLSVGDTLRLRILAGQVNFDGNDNWSVAYIG